MESISQEERALSRSSDTETENVKHLAVVSLKIERLLDMIFKAVDCAGFVGVDFLEKSELLLISVKSNFKQQDFKELISILSQIYQDFNKTELYIGLVSLRKICAPNDQLEEYITDELNKTIHTSFDALNIMFSVHLIENIRQYLHITRKNFADNPLTNSEILVGLQDTFRYSLHKTLFETFGIEVSRV